MISAVVFLVLLVVESSFSFPQFHALNHHHLPPTDPDPQTTNYINLKNNDAVHCNTADLLNAAGFEDLLEIIDRIASRNGVTPHMVLKKLQRRMKNKEDTEDNMINVMDGPPPPNFFNHPETALPPVTRLSPAANRAPYHLPEYDDSIEDTEVVFVPVGLPKLPIGKAPEKKQRAMSNIGPMMGKMSNMLPGVFLSQRSSHPRPMSGATVRVNSGDPLSLMSKDVMVTVSPFMTLIEALRQAESKYQNIMGLDDAEDIFTFARSEVFDCYVVDTIDSVFQDEDSGWKVTITDRDGQMVYDSFCLPNGKDNIIKPGTLISLTYVPLNV